MGPLQQPARSKTSQQSSLIAIICLQASARRQAGGGKQLPAVTDPHAVPFPSAVAAVAALAPYMHARARMLAHACTRARSRYKTGFLTWKCENERLEYEYCLYRDYLRRVEKCDAVRAAGGSCTAPAYRRDATD